MNARVTRLCATWLALFALSGQTAAPSGATPQVYYLHLSSAPFPHRSRSQGHTYDKVFYSAAGHYNDDTVAVVVPAGYRATPSVDYVVHFHGWRNNVSNVLTYYHLIDQLQESGRNAILIVPQGPLNAPDSGFGKLELDQNGFARFMSDVTAALNTMHIISTQNIGKIVLSAHSGGYGGEGGVLARGGLNDHVTDVLMFDCAYGYFEAYAAWARAPGHHLLSVFTGDTSTGNAALMGMLQGPQPNLFVRLSSDLALQNLRTRAPTFVLTTDVAHDHLLQERNWFALFLQSTALDAR